ncbi:MAG: putative ABC exporter domain-containing protein [Verrucomicrobia bacterium]|nr:putative ABC exporter domain-containing protein [Verrucomicrobiota bacterium]
MMGALIYLQFASTRNRLIARLKRLKQPKYLIGGIVGAIYIYFYFFRYLFLGSGHVPTGHATWFTPENRMVIECGAGLLLCVIVLASWILPNKRAALTFTEAEIAFLFPAPVARRTLIQFKLLRSQLGILFTVLIFTLISRRAGGNVLVHALGWWLVLSVLNLHFLGVSFLRTMLLDRGITHWRRRMAILGVVGGTAVGAGFWVWHSMPAMEVVDQPGEILEQVRRVLTTGPLPYLVYPFRLLVRPYLASDLTGFLLAAWPAVLILLAHYWFVLRADVAFEEASVEASRRLAERVAAARAGKLRGGGVVRARRPPFNLAPKGSPAVAFFWKNLVAAGQMFNKRLLIVLAIMCVAAFFGMSGSSHSGGFLSLLGMFALMMLVWSILLGPQVLAQDFRQDFKMADLIKVYPMRGWQVALGELLAPAVILTCIQWLLLPLALGGLIRLDRGAELDMGMIVGFALALALVAPPLNLLSFVIPNASVLLFPAWFQTDKAMPHGIEAMGQRIIMLLGQMLVLLISALPAGAVFTGVLLVVKWAAGWWVAAPLAGAAAAVVIAMEVAVAVVLMGRWFEKLDVSEEGGP